jgi:hypothetical protein
MIGYEDPALIRAIRRLALRLAVNVCGLFLILLCFSSRFDRTEVYTINAFAVLISLYEFAALTHARRRVPVDAESSVGPGLARADVWKIALLLAALASLWFGIRVVSDHLSAMRAPRVETEWPHGLESDRLESRPDPNEDVERYLDRHFDYVRRVQDRRPMTARGN